MGLEPMLVAPSDTTTPPTSAPADARGRAASPGDGEPGSELARVPADGGEGQVQAARPLLGNTVDNFSAITAVTDAQQKRAERFEFRDDLRSVLTMLGDRANRLVTCGSMAWDPDGVQLRCANGHAGFAGLASCGAQACPVCAVKVAVHRAEELGQVLAYARREKKIIVMVTLTVRHILADRLPDLWDAVADGWHGVTRGAAWVSEDLDKYADRLASWYERGAAADAGRGRAPRGWREGKEPARRIGDQERYGVMGWVRAVEVTRGTEHGWHPHAHAVLVVDPVPGEDRLVTAVKMRQLGERMHARWAAALEKHGYYSLRDSGGLDVTVAEAAEKRLADYLTKAAMTGEDPAKVRASVEKKGRGLAREATMGALKTGRFGSRTPFEIARGALTEMRTIETRLTPAQVQGLAQHFNWRSVEVEGHPVADQPVWAILEDLGLTCDDLRAWVEFIYASRGRRMIAWSAGLREMAFMSKPEMTDDQIVSIEIGSEADAVLNLPVTSWVRVRRRAAELLTVTEVGGADAARAWLDARNIPWTEPTPAEPEAEAEAVSLIVWDDLPMIPGRRLTAAPEGMTFAAYMQVGYASGHGVRAWLDSQEHQPALWVQ